jgi:plastocyanin
MRGFLLAGLLGSFAASSLASWTPAGTGAPDSPATAQAEQRADIVIRNYEFLLTQPTSIRLHMPTIIILRNQDIVRHGFTSTTLASLPVQGEGEGIAAYGKRIDGFYVDPGKTLVIRFVPERPGNYSFKCDLHPNMKGELYLLEVPAA